MIEITGKYNTALVFTDALEESAGGQIRTLLDQPFVRGERIRVMPDVHAGAGCTIGTTMTVSDAVVPSLVGVDIGCGMETVRLKETRVDLPKLDSLIKARIPAGVNVRDKAHGLASDIDLGGLGCADRVDLARGRLSIGTLGGGNHFIELDRDDEGNLYLVVHSGSRKLGLEVAQHYQKAAWEQMGKPKDVPYALAQVSGALFDSYLRDMALMQSFARLNRRAMVAEILKGMHLHAEDAFTTIHNYIDTNHRILRKGAVSARAGERLLIPINMRDGALICEGKGNDDWNQSAPHGAGRLMSRREAKARFTLGEFTKQMDGIFSTTVKKDTLDECPMAYKPIEEILSAIGPTAKVLCRIRPVYNFKAAGD